MSGVCAGLFRLRVPAVAAATAAVVTLGAAAPAALAADRPPRLVVTSLHDSGPGTLRAAIAAADARPPGALTTIAFAVRGTIWLASSLPAVTRRVSIDGTTAPGYRPGGPPVVAIAFDDHPGLRFAAGSGGSGLLGLALDDASGAGVTLQAGAIVLNLNYIGLDLRGRAARNDGDGVYVAASSGGDLIGLNPRQVSGTVGNVISANAGNGIVLAGASGNVISANRIGTTAAGDQPAGNGGNGIWVTGGARGNEIGGTAFVDAATGQANNPTGSKGTVPPVFVVPPLGNLISGNRGDGVLIDRGSEGNMLNGNFIGTTARGNAPVGNGGNGVEITGANGNALTGCRFVNNPFVYYNVLSGNGRNGLRITNSNGTLVQGNFFGIGANNTAIVGNRRDGILVDGSSAGTLVGGVIPLGNVSAGNGLNGIEVAGTACGFITFNTFGGLLAFKGAAPNGQDGLLITSTGGDNLARTNVFSGNRRNGIELAGDASGVTIDPDIVGLTTNGKAALPNGGDGLRIGGTAHDNWIGGSLPSVIPQNTFSGNRGYGIVITGQAYGNRVFGSDIGTEVLGVAALGNGKGGILIGGSANRNVIGGTLPLPSNLISGNAGIGVTMEQGTSGNMLLYNFIGLNRLGLDLPNSGLPYLVKGTGNVVRDNRIG